MSAMKAFFLGLKLKARNFLRKENGEVNIIVIVVLIAIALALVVIFKDKIVEILQKLFDSIGESADEVTNIEIT